MKKCIWKSHANALQRHIRHGWAVFACGDVWACDRVMNFAHGAWKEIIPPREPVDRADKLVKGQVAELHQHNKTGKPIYINTRTGEFKCQSLSDGPLGSGCWMPLVPPKPEFEFWVSSAWCWRIDRNDNVWEFQSGGWKKVDSHADYVRTKTRLENPKPSSAKDAVMPMPQADYTRLQMGLIASNNKVRHRETMAAIAEIKESTGQETNDMVAEVAELRAAKADYEDELKYLLRHLSGRWPITKPRIRELLDKHATKEEQDEQKNDAG